MQNRRVSAVRYEYDGGSVVAYCNTDGASRQPQYTALDVVTTHLTAVILDGVAGSPSGTQAAVEKVAISEITVS